MEHSDIINKYIQDELQLNCFIGLFSPESLPLSIHCSSFDVTPKANSNGRRLITDLSSPNGASVNEEISSKHCSLSYIDTIACQAAKLGQGTMLAKVYIKLAYHIVPVHPNGRHLLGVQWKGAVYIDAMLPLGLRLALKIFTALADTIE